MSPATTTTTATTATHLKVGDAFYLAGRNGRGESRRTVVALERQPRNIVVTTDSAIGREVWNLTPNRKVWIETTRRHVVAAYARLAAAAANVLANTAEDNPQHAILEAEHARLEHLAAGEVAAAEAARLEAELAAGWEG